MMDALAIEAAEAAVQCGYPEGAGAVLDRRARRRRGRGRAPVRPGGAASAARPARSRSGSPPTTPSARCSGRAASPPSRRSAGSAPTTSSRTASSRGPCCPRCCAASPRCRSRAGVRVANVFHAGDGNLHPLVLFDDAVEGAGRAGGGGLRRDPRPLHRARRVHHRRARRRLRQGQVHAADVLRGRPRHHAAGALRLRPGRDLQPRQGLPTPRLCGEVPGRNRGAHPLVDGRPGGGQF